MKTLFRFPLPTLIGCFLISFSVANAQMVVDNLQKEGAEMNPNADRDIKIATDFIKAIVIDEDQTKARTMVIPGFKAYGPAMADSSTLDQTLQGWQRTYVSQKNRKVVARPLSFRIKTGPYKGDWVSIWGDYTFTESGKTITFPYTYLMMINDGKIVGARIYHDTASIMTQLGYKIAPPDVATK